MSVLLEHAIETFEPSTTSLVEVDDTDLDGGAHDVPAEPIAEFASHYDALAHPEEEWTCIPLHEPDSATVTDEYVAVADHAIHGDIVVYRRDGDRDFCAIEQFGRTALAGRIRFWHADYIPDERPSYYTAPLAEREPARNPIERDRLFDDMASYVAAERAATRARNRDRATSASPTAIYERGGEAIPELACTGDHEDGEYRFRVDVPRQARPGDDWAYFVETEYGIHEGNEVLLHPPDDGTAPDAFPVDATVERIRGRTLWLTLDWGTTDDTTAIGNYLSRSRAGFGMTALLNPVPFERESEAIETLRDRNLGSVLAGERTLTFANTAAAESDAFDDELNQEQAEAVRYALLADDLFCIHGPPGTGKTRTLVEIVRRSAQAGRSVLVCADSNQAVDNLVAGTSTLDDADPRSLHAYGQHESEEFTLDRRNAGRSSHAVVRQRYADVAGTADVVAATNSTAATLAREFDVVVLDEATQSTCTASCIPLASAQKAILAGDHEQLPPFSATEEPPQSSYGLSLFEHLYADGGVYEGVGIQLRTQYRMHRDIAYFPNRTFYDRSLRNGRSIESLGDRPAIEGYDVGGTVETRNHSKYNRTEARMVVHLVRDLIESGLATDDVGVITPYVAQVETIRSLLENQVPGGEAIAVDTVDAFQGSERTAILLSLVRSNATGDLGFLGRTQDGPRRLNVALTRAKRYLGIVADWDTLRYEHTNKPTDVYGDFYDFFEGTGRLHDVEPEFIPVP